ncbi:hypothetical protein V6N11_060335 [Hibiscus sabdariffa]|uniref:Uncharacterized protein n=1 Tax=Hibiscus sabdariffa TaxID=183260 RepID=A0ABR2QQC5_9ROSI
MCMECRIACQKPSPGHDSEANLRRKGKFICFPRCVLWELDFTAFPGKESADSTLEMKDKTEDENGETDIEKKKRNLKDNQQYRESRTKVEEEPHILRLSECMYYQKRNFITLTERNTNRGKNGPKNKETKVPKENKANMG